MADLRVCIASAGAISILLGACFRIVERHRRIYREPVVSVIIPAHNALPWIHQALESVLQQRGIDKSDIEVSIYNDLSSDATEAAIKDWIPKLRASGISVVTSGSSKDQSSSLHPLGDGGARNKAVRQSRGRYLCFLDADDIMMPNRISCQLKLAKKHQRAIIGSGFTRYPKGSTEHYTKWANSLSPSQLYLHQYREITIIQPTWFLHRSVYDNVGGYPELRGLNDMEFFHRHLDQKGELLRIDKPLVVYRYTNNSLSWKSSRRDLLRSRIRYFQRRVISQWKTFSVWGAGRDGKNFFIELSKENRLKISMFVDIDAKKIERGFHSLGYNIPVRHWTEVKPPVVICVAWGRTGGDLERNIKSLGLVEGKDYWHFS
ncbi:hypothetical protein AAMO2058_001526100 [Amorphochlora amoebiformis]